MLKLELTPTRVCPIIRCDVCAQIIRDAKDGNVMIPPPSALPAEPRFTHKQCCAAFDAAYPGWGADELDIWLTFLLDNLRFDFEEATRRASLYGFIG